MIYGSPTVYLNLNLRSPLSSGGWICFEVKNISSEECKVTGLSLVWQLMSASRLSPLLATAVALGLIVATTIVVYSKTNKKAASQGERSAGTSTTAADRSEMEAEEVRERQPACVFGVGA